MNLNDIEKLITMFEKASISSLELELDGTKIKLTKDVNISASLPSPRPVAVNEKRSNPSIERPLAEEEKKEELQSGEEYIKSPLVGTYHQAAYKDAKPFVEEGSKVKKGQTLCIVEAMKVMNEIKAPKDGTIKKILAKEGDIIEYDQKLFVLGA